MNETFGMSDNRWAIYLDIEGTSTIYKEQGGLFYDAFNKLFETIYAIGSNVFSETPTRLFVHQVGGDGLLIVSEFAEESSEKAISIAVVLLQALLTNGLVGKAGISEGTFADVKSCFPSLRSVPKTASGYRLGEGLLTTFPVMGTALINAHRIATSLPRGCLLRVDPVLLRVTYPRGVVISDPSNPIVVDWIHTRTATMELIVRKTEIALPSCHHLEQLLVQYVSSAGSLGESEWGRNTLSLNGCATRLN
jgi:hypothetical protein